MKSELEEELALLMAVEGLPQPEREYRFHETRKWRFDFAWPRVKLAVECDGGLFSGGRHTRGAGYAKDTEKFNTAVLLGWRVLHFTKQQIASGNALKTIWEALL